ncbi:16S rRNA (cytosine(967)-C(5))-methyltransferase RsmB [Oceanobacter kriegii]|uniref:16S rRNA (cytosine(967)-C(5))-methyltransferase RsmB n=1 Tax=Oceanobacter kriegii TaxID=64972 RepID=UPI000415775A|nr:16S rRNA (cytosine(967)-C(5))-methyltransferase RsmB [Oceanobacter kriegii]
MSDSNSPASPQGHHQPGNDPWAKAKRLQSHNVRALAAIALQRVVEGASLNTVMPDIERQCPDEDRGFLRDLILGSCRYHHRLNALAKMLLNNSFNNEQAILHQLLIVGLYQLDVQQKEAHAAVHTTVEAASELGHDQARGVMNACLRRYLREQEELTKAIANNPVTTTSHPKWLVKMLTKGWPEQWPEILANNNELPPLCLRVNEREYSRDEYLAKLFEANIDARLAHHSDNGIYLAERCDITKLPGFADGAFSVQDEAAQLAAELLNPQDGEKVLDACCAPGGKSCHLLELADIDLTAVDLEASRMTRVEENLTRLKLNAKLISADVIDSASWWDGEPFDAILLDAPCSATGVIRRHPDIKLLRRREDIEQLADVQAAILDACWAMLKPGGRLLYATCSVLPQENSEQIEAFLSRHADLVNKPALLSLDKPWGSACNAGRQLFPTPDGTDGFYYALLQKPVADTDAVPPAQSQGEAEHV